MKATYISPEFSQQPIEKPENSTYISYTQFSTYQKCQQRWKLKYADRIKKDEPSIHTVFGNAMHTVIQHYLQVMFLETIKKADSLDFNQLLLQELKNNYAQDIEKYQRHFSSKEELSEFYLDGLETLNYLRKKRKTYIDRKNWILVGTEIPILLPPIQEIPNVLLMGFLDIVFKDKNKNKFYIFDLKTSTKGWTKWDKEDETKVAQLILYKIYFSKQYNIPIEDIEVEFIILKRKVDENSAWPQRRIQEFSPTQGSITIKRVLNTFETFIKSCFLPDGSYNKLNSYQANSGKNGFNCRFCEFKDAHELCVPDNRI